MDKLKQTLGLAYRSKSVVLGTDTIVANLRNGKIKLILLSTNASFNTQKLVQDKARFYNCKVLLVQEFDGEILSQAIKKKNIVVLGISNTGFRKLIMQDR